MWSVVILGPKIFGLWWSAVVCGIQADWCNALRGEIEDENTGMGVRPPCHIKTSLTLLSSFYRCRFDDEQYYVSNDVLYYDIIIIIIIINIFE